MTLTDAPKQERNGSKEPLQLLYALFYRAGNAVLLLSLLLLYFAFLKFSKFRQLSDFIRNGNWI